MTVTVMLLSVYLAGFVPLPGSGGRTVPLCGNKEEEEKWQRQNEVREEDVIQWNLSWKIAA